MKCLVASQLWEITVWEKRAVAFVLMKDCRETVDDLHHRWFFFPLNVFAGSPKKSPSRRQSSELGFFQRLSPTKTVNV